ncbi:hypothetical protein Moror_4318 [Moniliophthora roreri MCA 2997]|uniref:F-box domain-containing protein n=1 Tax=Moniliophthora roreri (strain MCA 2997) TaxID=1381753 RepID=V2XMT7_MONRO|nr:hypothetical protein Moror_4318 [Moniliophthora roreri MCA 2997]
MASSSFFPTNNHAALTDIADSLSAYLDSNAQSESLPAFDFDHLSEVMMQITADMQRAQMHANAYEEAASSARMKASRLRSILNSCKNLSTPLVRMPSEVLAIIFEHCIQVDTAAHVFSPHAMPWVLSQTCRKWRSTVLSMPSLWTVVRVNTRIMGFLRHRKSLLPLQIWLSRSYPLPISCLAILDDPKTGVFNADVLELLVHHSTRWYAVHITLGAQCDLYHQLCCADLHLPSLHSVFLKAHISSHPDGARMHVSTVWEAPNLTDATLLVESESADLSPAIVPRWSQLEELAWSSNTSKAFLDVASTFVNLRYCTLDIIHDVDTQDIHRAALPRLRHLETFGSFRSTLLILNHLSLPSLEYLDLDFDECIDSVADHILISLGRLQARSRCNLRHLSAPFSLFSSPNTPVLVEKIGTVEGLRVILSVEEDSEQAILNFARSKNLQKAPYAAFVIPGNAR